MIPAEILDSITLHFSSPGTGPLRILASAALSGGSINRVFRLKTDRGDFCLKYNHAGSYPGMFESESKGLELIASAGEIRVPVPLLCSTAGEHTFLLLEYIEAARPLSDMMHRFGTALARLHRHHAGQFGLGFDNYMGALPQRNAYHDDWAGFFLSERLEPQVRMAVDRGLAGRELAALTGSLGSRLGSMFPVEPPALIHGDLWNGNYIVDGEGTAALIDPAVCYGHREADIAMTTLFGGFSSDFYDGYAEEYPMEPGWRERLGLYNLYPLLVHLNLFGTAYLGEIMTILRRY